MPGRHSKVVADGGPAAEPAVVDLHTHTTRSDGVLEPTELVSQVVAAGVRTLAITDHDSLAAYRELTAAATVPPGVELITGVEINALARGIPDVDELHVLGYGIDPTDEAFEAGLRDQRRARRLRFDRTLARLRELGMPIDDQIAQLDLTRDDALGRPTIGRALTAAGHATSVEDAFARLIGAGMPAHLPRDGLGPVDAIRMIRAAGGLPALAHFWEAPNQVGLLRELRAEGLAGLEVHHLSFSPEVSEALGAIALDLGLVPTGGTDYHGDLGPYAEAHAALRLPAAVGDGLRRALG